MENTGRNKKYSKAKCTDCAAYEVKCIVSEDRKEACENCVKYKRTCVFKTSDPNTRIFFYGDHKPLPERYATPQGDTECCHTCVMRSRRVFGKDVVGDGEFPCSACKQLAEQRAGRMDKVDGVSGVTCARTKSDGSIEVHRLLKAKQKTYLEQYGHRQSRKPADDLDEAGETAMEYWSSSDDAALQPTNPPRKLGGLEGGRKKNTQSIEYSRSRKKRWQQDLDEVPEYTRDEYDNEEDELVHKKDFASLAFVSSLTLRTLKSISHTRPSCAASLLNTDPEPRTRAEALSGPEAAEWSEAMNEEYQSLVDNGTFEETPRPRYRKVLKSRWVFRRKRDAQNIIQRYKARGVGKGFSQVHGLDFDETYASVVKSSSYRLFFALQAKLGMKCRQIDIQTAFLHGDLEHEVYMEPLDGFPVAPGNVLLLKKSIYGLKQSPRQWYHKLRKYLESVGWRVSKFDQSVYIGPNLTFMTVYMDDIRIYAMEDEPIDRIVQQIGIRFKIKDLGEGDFYLGMHVHKNALGDIHVHQTAYIKERLQTYGFEDLRSAETPMDSNNKPRKHVGEPMSAKFQKHYQSVMGSLNYASIVSRPDISTAVGVLCRFNANPNNEHLAAAERVWGYLKEHPTDGLTYKRHVKGEPLNDLYIMSDADWAGCPDTRKSTSGYVVMLAGAPISWISKKQDCNALSSCEAEYIAGSIAAQEAIWCKNMINDLQIPGLEIDKVPFYVDNQSAIAVAKNPEHHNRMKHIENRMHFLRDCVQNGQIEIKWIPSKDNLADFLTKALPKDQHHRLKTMTGILPATCDNIEQHDNHDSDSINSSAFSDTSSEESEDDESQEDSESST